MKSNLRRLILAATVGTIAALASTNAAFAVHSLVNSL